MKDTQDSKPCNCGARNPYTANFCGMCGKSYDAATPPTTTAPVTEGDARDMPKSICIVIGKDGQIDEAARDNMLGTIYVRLDEDANKKESVDTRYFRRAPTTAIETFENLCSAVEQHDRSVVLEASGEDVGLGPETYRNMIMCDALNLARDHEKEIRKALQQASGARNIPVSKFIDMAYEAIQHWDGDSQLEVLSTPLECALEGFVRTLAENYPNGLRIITEPPAKKEGE